MYEDLINLTEHHQQLFSLFNRYVPNRLEFIGTEWNSIAVGMRENGNELYRLIRSLESILNITSPYLLRIDKIK